MSTRQRVQARLTRNKVAVVGGVYLLVVGIIALLAPLLAPHDENLATRFQDILFSPSSEYWLGTDHGDLVPCQSSLDTLTCGHAHPRTRTFGLSQA